MTGKKIYSVLIHRLFDINIIQACSESL